MPAACVPASEAADASSFVDDLVALGGTNIQRAMEQTLQQSQTDRPQIVLFVTDGLPTEGETSTETLLEEVADRAGSQMRIFTFGVGYDVNTTLLDTLAQEQRGSSAYVQPGEDIETAVTNLYQKISVPLLSDVALEFGLDVSEVYPYPLSDIFAGSQTIIVGRYKLGGTTQITLTGTVNGEPATTVFKDITFADDGGSDFIPRLWATRKVGYLLTQVRLHGADQELIDEIVDLSVRYGIVTPYTSFLIDETEDALSTEGREEIATRALCQPRPRRSSCRQQRRSGRENQRHSERDA